MIMTFVDTTNQVANKRNRFHWRNYYYRLSHITMTHFYWNFRSRSLSRRPVNVRLRFLKVEKRGANR